MRPSKIRSGQRLLINSTVGAEPEYAYFVKRIPARCGFKAKNFLRFPAFEKMDDPDDDGTCEMSDYDLSRRGEYA